MASSTPQGGGSAKPGTRQKKLMATVKISNPAEGSKGVLRVLDAKEAAQYTLAVSVVVPGSVARSLRCGG